MAATAEMVAIALRTKPHGACLVPERREERTTEGGLDAKGQHDHLAPVVAELKSAGIRVSLFIAADDSADRGGGLARCAGDRNPHRSLVRSRRRRRAPPRPMPSGVASGRAPASPSRSVSKFTPVMGWTSRRRKRLRPYRTSSSSTSGIS